MTEPEIRRWLSGKLSPAVERGLERLGRAGDVRRVAVLPDVHLAEMVCVGVAVATSSRLYPEAVGGDIGCGMAALRFEGQATALLDDRIAARILAGLYAHVPGNRHSEAQLPEMLRSATLSDPRLEKIKGRDARVEFATLGRGNHFLELQSDEQGELWLMVHSGSRVMGPAILAHHLAKASLDPTGLRFLEADSPAGMAYQSDQVWALAYAQAARRSMAEAAASVVREVGGFSADPSSYFDCLHNHVRQETHEGAILWVHRKGALSAAAGEPGVIPGSMGTASFHVEGRGCAASLTSSSHGAGRVSSRADARRAVSVADLRRQMKGVWFDHRLASRLVEEAPAAYKDISDVMRAQRDLTRIVRRLRPLLSYKAV
jgi:tRNA-splicing ligase RtcB